MNRKEITNSQDYKATEAALEWWYSLQEEQRKATDIDAEPDIVDAYSDGVLYGWNNPNWISVEERLPKERKVVWVRKHFNKEVLGEFDIYDSAAFCNGEFQCDNSGNVTHWMEIQPPRKEDIDYVLFQNIRTQV